MEAQGGNGHFMDTTMTNDVPIAPPRVEEAKVTYKSFKKKYRKMRMIFDEKMRLSNELFLLEQQALATAKRLAQMNNQTLDLLLDVNESAQIPAEKRFDLSVETPALPVIPPLVGTADLSQASEVNTIEGKAVYKEIRAMVEEKATTKAAARPSKSLATLMANVPHRSLSNPLVPKELVTSLRSEDGQSAPLRYLTMDQVDEYLYDVDAALGSVPPLPPRSLPITSHDLALRNPQSVYNWLRQHEPRVFLQDGEGSEKSSGKPGALRGAGKRNSIPAPSVPNTLEFVEEDGAGYDALAPSSTKNKRKRDADDDGGYHPKSGRVEDGKGKKPRSRKKKSDESNSSVTSKRSKGKSKASSPPPPERHPFGNV